MFYVCVKIMFILALNFCIKSDGKYVMPMELMCIFLNKVSLISQLGVFLPIFLYFDWFWFTF